VASRRVPKWARKKLKSEARFEGQDGDDYNHYQSKWKIIIGMDGKMHKLP
jgi:hypothetical protein